MSSIPLPFTCLHKAFSGDGEDDHGNTIPQWGNGVPTPCFWWSGDSSEPRWQNAGSDQALVDLTLVVDSSLAVDHRDRFTVDGHDFEVVGLPKDFDHGPFGFTPGRIPVELKWVG